MKSSARTIAALGLAAVAMLGLAGTKGSVPADGAETGVGAQATLVLTPELQDFGVVTVGSQSAPVTFTLRNTGTGAATIVAVSLTGDAPENYSLVADGCGSKVLAHSASCTISVRFRPEARGNHLATLRVEADQGPPRLAFMLGSARSLTGLGATGPAEPSAECVKARKALALVRKKVRQTKRKLRGAGTKSRRQAIRKRLAGQQRKVRRLEASVVRRCGRATD